MATLNLLFRSTKSSAFLTCRLQFRKWENENSFSDIFVDAKSNRFISKKDWKIYVENKSKNSKSLEIINLKNSIDNELAELRKFILTDFDIKACSLYDRDWLQNKLDVFYNKESQKPKELPSFLIPFMEEQLKTKVCSDNTKSNIKSLISKLKGFEIHRSSKIELSEINFDFSEELNEYFNLEEYAPSTIERDFRAIRTFCNLAKKKGVVLDVGFEDFKYRIYKSEIPYPFFNFDEIEKIKKLQDLPEYLDNARDWLIISLYTGQRISDFLNFTKNNIWIDNRISFLDFKQVKGKKLMVIPILEEVQSILSKRNGYFPRKISDQKYNEYIKEVAKRAKLTEEIIGFRIIKNAETKKKRRVKGMYPKWELVTSHIGRRSFATNYYGIIPTSDLMYITGHTKESVFLTYINKTASHRAHDIANRFQILVNTK